jgi:hypothetical protein
MLRRLSKILAKSVMSQHKVQLRLTAQSDGGHARIRGSKPSRQSLRERPVRAVGSHAHERDVAERVEELEHTRRGEDGVSLGRERVAETRMMGGTDLCYVRVHGVIVLAPVNQRSV